MRHTLALCLILAACSYTPQSGETVATDAPGTQEPDAPPLPPGVDAEVELDAPPQVTCTTTDSSLALCLELEDATTTTAVDGSGKHHDAAVSNATATTRDVPNTSRALTLTSSSAVMIGDSPDFDLQTLTISAWVRRTATPSAGQRFGVVDLGRKQAAMAIDDQGKVVCMVRTDFDVWVGTGGATAINEWSLIACTYDAPDLCMYTFKNGSSTPTVQCGSTDGEPIDTTVSAGGTVGALFDAANQPVSRLTGAIDSIRVYGRALSASQLCTANGLSGC